MAFVHPAGRTRCHVRVVPSDGGRGDRRSKPHGDAVGLFACLRRASPGIAVVTGIGSRGGKTGGGRRAARRPTRVRRWVSAHPVGNALAIWDGAVAAAERGVAPGGGRVARRAYVAG
ncbi:hypothetical protein LBMAG42_35130 [Deltaproteobacteria bacterium]|nr:hypothetical protein LBMAG42_35130 [Deltaproteobacteria bacterium]